MRISVIIPVYNEEKTLIRVVNEVLKLKLEKEIIVVDDGSTRDVRKTLSGFAKNKEVKVLKHKKNMGKGCAIRTGLENASGDVIVIQDADFEYPPRQIPRLIKPILDGEADVVFGSRFLGNIKDMSLTHNIGNKILTFITRLLYGSSITDMETGHKAFRRKVIKGIHLTANRFEIEPEITAKILMAGYRIFEVPIDYTARRGGKKISIKDGFVALKWLVLFRYVILHKQNYSGWEFSTILDDTKKYPERLKLVNSSDDAVIMELPNYNKNFEFSTPSEFS